MATMLRSPSGGHYETDDPGEITNLTRGHGYTVVSDEDTSPEPAATSPQSATDGPPHTDEQTEESAL